MSNSPDQEWQGDLLDYTFKKVSQPGKLIRICSEDFRFPKRKISLSKVGKTITTPSFSKMSNDKHWPVMNKPGSLKYFFNNYEFNDNDILIFLDPDMIFIKPWVPKVKIGHVYGQRWKGYSKKYCEETSIQPNLCPDNNESCLMFPFAILAEDMKKIVNDIENFARKGYEKKKTWMADMSAFQIAMEKHNLICHAEENIGLCNNWNNNNDESAPIMHYCQPIFNINKQKIWYKYKHNSMLFIPRPSLAINRVDKEVLKAVREYEKDIGIFKVIEKKSEDGRFQKNYQSIILIQRLLKRISSIFHKMEKS